MSVLSQFLQGGLRFMGEYAPGTTYYCNNIVLYNNLSFICTSQSVGNLPTDTNYWLPFTKAPDVVVATVGAGTTPASFYLTSNGSTIILNKPS